MNLRTLLIFMTLGFMLNSCGENAPQEQPLNKDSAINSSAISLIVLGTVQDAGSPHMGCRKICCRDLFNNPDPSRRVVSLGLIDNEAKKTWLFEATPDIVPQCKALKRAASFSDKETPDGIFLTHAHIGHYAGLMYLGREALGAAEVPVYAMPRLKSFLESNGPWDQLVALDNISLQAIKADSVAHLGPSLKVTPFLVPHRDEYSETVGYTIEGESKKALFIPDIDKWEKWDRDIIEEIAKVDYAFLDATFYDGQELNNRDISEIPHPFIIESMELFRDLPPNEKAKVHFIHLNHTNPGLDFESEQSKAVLDAGFRLARIGQRVRL
mgnify:CR=1 FL=1